MAKRNELPLEQRRREGAALELIVKAYLDENDLSAAAFCEELDLSASQLSLWYSGKKPIPTPWLLDLAIKIGFDARIVRPELENEAMRLLSAMGMAGSVDLEKAGHPLTKEGTEMVRSAIRAALILARRGRK